MNEYCTLCKVKLQLQKYNINITRASYSKTLFLDLIPKIIGESCVLYSNICGQCYQLLNDFDESNVKVRQITNLIKYYIENNNTVINHEISSIQSHRNSTNCTEKEFGSSICYLNINDTVSNKVNNRKSVHNVNIDDNIQIDSLEVPSDKCSYIERSRSSFKCEVCGKSYDTNLELVSHMKVHMSSFKCTFCDKSFTQKVSLLRHLPLHTGDKPYQCEICGKTFIHHTSFNFHKQNHFGEKKYNCTFCGAALSSSSHLKRHMRVHVGERRHVCEVCGKKFSENYNLIAHRKLHEDPEECGKRRYSCNSCGCNFTNRTMLNDHKRSCEPSSPIRTKA